MNFAMAFNYQKPSRKGPYCENRHSDCHNFTLMRFILLSYKQQTDRYISPTQPIRVETQNADLQAIIIAGSDFCLVTKLNSVVLVHT